MQETLGMAEQMVLDLDFVVHKEMFSFMCMLSKQVMREANVDGRSIVMPVIMTPLDQVTQYRWVYI